MATRLIIILATAMTTAHVNSVDVPVNIAQGPPPPPPGSSGQCNCAQLIVSSSGATKTFHSHALGPFQLSSSHFNAFKSTVYRNSRSLTLIGGKLQTWRIQGGSRAGRIMVKHPSCKEACPTSCSPDWVVYQRPRYVKDNTIKFECRDGNDGVLFP